MLTHWKYPLQKADTQVVPMPQGAQIRHAAVQGNDLCLWVSVVSTRSPKPRTIRIFGTGTPVETAGNLKFIGTVMDDPYVWHVYEEVC